MELVVLLALVLRVTLAALFNYTESSQNDVCVCDISQNHRIS